MISALFWVGMSISSCRLQLIARPRRQRRKGESNCHRAERDAQRTDIEPAIAVEGVEYPTARQWAECHAKAGCHCRRAEHRAHDTLTEIFARKHRIERHHAAIGR